MVRTDTGNVFIFAKRIIFAWEIHKFVFAYAPRSQTRLNRKKIPKNCASRHNRHMCIDCIVSTSLTLRFHRTMMASHWNLLVGYWYQVYMRAISVATHSYSVSVHLFNNYLYSRIVEFPFGFSLQKRIDCMGTASARVSSGVPCDHMNLPGSNTNIHIARTICITFLYKYHPHFVALFAGSNAIIHISSLTLTLLPSHEYVNILSELQMPGERANKTSVFFSQCYVQQYIYVESFSFFFLLFFVVWLACAELYYTRLCTVAGCVLAGNSGCCCCCVCHVNMCVERVRAFSVQWCCWSQWQYTIIENAVRCMTCDADAFIPMESSILFAFANNVILYYDGNMDDFVFGPQTGYTIGCCCCWWTYIDVEL